MPVEESIDPETITRESYLTITGSRFGDDPGAVYACTDIGMSSCVALNIVLPLACGDTWTNTQIIAEVPNTTPPGLRYIVVENGLSGLQSTATRVSSAAGNFRAWVLASRRKNC